MTYSFTSQKRNQCNLHLSPFCHDGILDADDERKGITIKGVIPLHETNKLAVRIPLQ